MKFRTLALSAITAVSMIAGIDQVAADGQIEVKVNGNNMNEIATVLVTGVDGADPRYTHIPTNTLTYVAAVRGAWAHQGDYQGSDRPPFWLWITPWQNSQPVSEPLMENWIKYVIKRTYQDPFFAGAVNQKISPIELCNDKLKPLAGNARQTFLKQGHTFVYPEAYEIAANVYAWPDSITDPSHANYVSIKVPARIVCKPLYKPAPPATRDPLPPLFSQHTLRVEPAEIVQMGKFICPSKIKLYGRVEATRKFQGKALFVGPYYISHITPLNFPGKGVRNITATYTMNWQQKGGLTTAPSSEPQKQKLTFRFNIADNGGELWGSAEKTIEVSCRKIKVAVPTVGDEMTVKPAN